METEIWEYIPEFGDFYEFSSLGRIRSWYFYSSSYGKTIKKDTPKILSPGITLGYQVVNILISSKGIKHRDYVHRLIARCFMNNYDKSMVINHKNGIKNDNRLINLECVTRKQNTQHAIKTGLLVFGTCEKHSRTGLKNSDAIDIFNSPLTTKQLAKQYEISVSAVNGIKTGKTWSKITGKNYKKVYRSYLKEYEVLGILNNKSTYKRIASKYGVLERTVSGIKRGDYYSRITGIYRNKKTA